jgi:hypothetical protein
MRTTIRTGKFLVIVGLAVSSLLHTAPAAAAPHGKVWLLVNPQAAREDWQRRPLSGAFVVLDWTVTVPGPGSAVAYCRYSELARTNDQGEYEMEGPNLLTALAADVSFFAYSPGLEVIAFRYPGSRMLPQDITMTMSTRTAQQRLSWLAQVSRPGCPAPEPSDPRALFVPYLRALLDEAKHARRGCSGGAQQCRVHRGRAAPCHGARSVLGNARARTARPGRHRSGATGAGRLRAGAATAVDP